MLFNDSDFVSSADMLALDPEVANVAAAENISADFAYGIAAEACDEVGQKLLSETQAFTGFMPPFAMPYNQTAAVLNLVGPTINRSRIALSQVVVSGPNPTEFSVSRPSHIKRYAIYVALRLFFRAAFYRKKDDRYDKKRQLYADEIRKYYWPRLFNQGCPIVYKPLACPGAIHEYNAGAWGSGNVTTTAGTNTNGDLKYDLAISWVDQTSYLSSNAKGNSESAPSARVTPVDVPTGQVIAVTIAGLSPPNGLAPLNAALGQSLVIPGKASGWNIYVGAVGGSLYLQNPSPVPIGTLSYVLPGPPVLSGAIADQGQYPDAYFTMQKTLMRG